MNIANKCKTCPGKEFGLCLKCTYFKVMAPKQLPPPPMPAATKG